MSNSPSPQPAEDILHTLMEEDDEVVQVWYMLGLVQCERGLDECKPPARYYLHKAKKVCILPYFGSRKWVTKLTILVKEKNLSVISTDGNGSNISLSRTSVDA